MVDTGLLNNLEKALIDEIDMLLDNNYENEIELYDDEKLSIAQKLEGGDK